MSGWIHNNIQILGQSKEGVGKLKLYLTQNVLNDFNDKRLVDPLCIADICEYNFEKKLNVMLIEKPKPWLDNTTEDSTAFKILLSCYC